MMERIFNRLSEKSTRFGLVSAIGIVGGFSIADEKVSAICFLIAFISSLFTTGTKENGSAK